MSEVFYALCFVSWSISAMLCYLIARDRDPEKAGMAVFLGYAFGPLGVAAAFFVTESKQETQILASSTDEAEKASIKPRSIADIQTDLDRMKSNNH